MPPVIDSVRNRLSSKNLHTWMGGYLSHLARSALLRPRAHGTRHLIFAMCDHYEPLWGGADDGQGEARVRAWVEQYPKMAEAFRDSDGNGPQHSFFFPGEEYRPAFFDMLEHLVRGGRGEIELHLHHDGATAPRLREEVQSYLRCYSERGHFGRDAEGRVRYAFIHGNWALANGRPDGRYCGVNEELPLLFETGCYADFTFPAAPDISQPNIVNQIYWPAGDLSSKRAYEKGFPARVGERLRDRILMIEGPLALSKRPRRLSVRIDAAAVTAHDPGTPLRVRTWVTQNIHVRGRPEWVFVKVHTHGAPEKQAASLLGDGGRMMHGELCTKYNDGRAWLLHYVTAREMYNIALAAMAGKSGNPGDYRDFEIGVPPIRKQGTAAA